MSTKSQRKAEIKAGYQQLAQEVAANPEDASATQIGLLQRTLPYTARQIRKRLFAEAQNKITHTPAPTMDKLNELSKEPFESSTE